jgi:NAD(P)H-hydrate epimerase
MTAVPTHPLPTPNGDGLDADAALDALGAVLEKADAVLVGPGLGRADGTAQFVRRLLAATDLPLVVDADGLNALAGHIDDLAAAHADGRWLLTPHAGELRRLAENPDLDDPVCTAQELANQWNSTVLLKGQPSVVAAPNGRAYVSPAQNTALATAGTGDVLAGQCVSLLAQGLSPVNAAATALHIGSRAAQMYAADHDPRTLTAPALFDALPRAAHRVVDA